MTNPELQKNNITDKGYKIFPGKHFVYDTLTVTKSYGSVLTAICFVSHNFPVLKKKCKK